eukprot:CAMPEP_0206179064 /NCGR_PEP_ID=MMETSP1474-20131121/66363_1 /ASSEMBLY_ACC=CAM_ASM_001110 /TAXON_ID=97495 /ORGANISM="Imantonia sp., Strain RCC918" /LENGTH=208 /DNA_ID=CAMNT_0053592085 /DNA_START=45 /DNA_END=671 /DNA_ORIENTATION=+
MAASPPGPGARVELTREIGAFAAATLPVHVSLSCHLAVPRLLRFASRRPDMNWLGLDSRGDLVSDAATKAAALPNCRFLRANCWQHSLLSSQLASLGAPVTAVSIWMPDEWPKASHRQRRLVQPALLECLAPRLAEGATVSVSSDRPAVLAAAAEVFGAHHSFRPRGLMCDESAGACRDERGPEWSQPEPSDADAVATVVFVVERRAQ